jgi:hypothetical protein
MIFFYDQVLLGHQSLNIFLPQIIYIQINAFYWKKYCDFRVIWNCHLFSKLKKIENKKKILLMQQQILDLDT